MKDEISAVPGDDSDYKADQLDDILENINTITRQNNELRVKIRSNDNLIKKVIINYIIRQLFFALSSTTGCPKINVQFEMVGV